MHIKISQKLQPFSHEPGSLCPIPYTIWEVQVFPALLKFRNLETFEEKEIKLAIQGPVKGFTVMLNLEKGRVEVFGRGAEGYFRYFIDNEKYPFLKTHSLEPSKLRLSLGVHKKQDWDQILRRSNMAEVLPFWLKLSGMIPFVPLPKKTVGTMQLLDDLPLLFQAGFEGILSPRLNDEKHLGLVEDTNVKTCPLGLLHEGAKRILALFFQEEGQTLSILPALPKEFHAGRLIGIETEYKDIIDIEWSKKEIKKIVILPAETRSIKLKLQRRMNTYRVRKSLRQRGERRKKTEPLELKAFQRLYLDRFEH